MTMPREPHEKIRMALKFRNQIRQSYGILRIDPPTHFPRGRIRSHFDVYRYVRGDDHELTGSITISKFFFKPGPTCRVQKAMPVDVVRTIVFLLGIVEHDNLDRYIRLRHKAITGKTIVGIDQFEPVTDRTGRGIEKFFQPLRSQK